MELSLRSARIAAGATFAIASALVLFGIWSFGIWDPWELASADIARHLAAGEPPTDEGVLRAPPLAPWLVAAGFRLFGTNEWAGRVPIALTGILSVAVAYWTLSRFAGRRAGIYAALITATSPLFLFNARQMIGAAPGFLASALVLLCALSLVLQPSAGRASGRAGRLLWAVGLIGSIALATAASGILVGVLPPLGAVAAVVLARGELRLDRYATDPDRWRTALLVVTVPAVLALHTVRVIAADADAYSFWIGGAPRGSTPGTFEVILEQIFHSFAPWSALAPVALGRAFAGRGQEGADEVKGAPLEEEPSLRLALALWAGFGFAAQTVYVSRFGPATFLPVVALAGSVALLLRDVERSGRGSWAVGLVALLLSALLVRDFRGYPAVPASGLGVEGLTVPEGFTARSGWAAVLGTFGLLALLGASVDREERLVSALAAEIQEKRRRARALPRWLRIATGFLVLASGVLPALLMVLGWPGRLLRAQWERGVAYRAWLVFFAQLAVACTVFGIVSFLFGDERPYIELQYTAAANGLLAASAWSGLLGIGIRLAFFRALSEATRARLGRVALYDVCIAIVATAVAIACGILGQEGVSSLAVRVGQALTFVVPAILVLIGLGRCARAAFSALGQWALAPMLIAGLIVGGYTSLRFQPLMSQHFSPREVYDAYNELAGEGEALGEWRVGGRAAAYYARGEIRELAEQEDVLRFLASPERVWLAFRADDLAALNRAYRQRAGRHLFVADATSSRVLLATNQPIEGRENQNYLAEAVIDVAPRPQFPVGADFDRRIELIGYDLDLPGGRTVGPGQAFTVTWYWRCRAPVPGSYQVFLHVDGAGQRLNGDHEPVEGRYPVRLWDEGDIIVDRQELRVPANFPPGAYTFFIGFYAGESRLDVVSGPADEVDRVRAGTLIVR